MKKFIFCVVFFTLAPAYSERKKEAWEHPDSSILDKFVFHSCRSKHFLKAINFKRNLQMRNLLDGELKGKKTVDFEGIALKILPSGGLVAPTAFVAPTVKMEKYAMVLDRARVTGDVRLGSSALVGHSALVYEQAHVDGMVCQNARVHGQVYVHPRGLVYGQAELSGKFVVEKNRHIGGNIKRGTAIFPKKGNLNPMNVVR